jgi:protoporphyrinogen oxidase
LIKSPQSPKSIVVLGGGVAGLAAGHYLARDGHAVTVVERAPVTGGLCGSFQSHGFTLDYGPHKLYSVVPGILDELRAIMGDELLEHRKKNRIRLLGRYMEYPLSLGNLLPLLGPVRAAKLGLGYAGALLGGLLPRPEATSYEDYLLRRFGRGVYELVFEPLAQKVWGNPRELAAELARARIPSGGATELILRLLKLRANAEDLDAKFFYYPKGGFGAWPERLASNIRAAGGRILTSATPVSLEREGAAVRSVSVERGGEVERLPCDVLVSSIPIHALAAMLHPGDAAVEAASKKLRLRDLALVYVILKQDKLTDDHWIFFPERQFPFNRLFEQKAMSPSLGPAGRTAVCCDLTCDEGDALWSSSDEVLVKRCLDAIVAAGLTRPEAFEAGFVKRFRKFYPMYTVDFRERLAEVYDRLRVADNLILTGRLGMFNYNNSDHCLDMGRFLAGELQQGRTPGQIWSGLEERVRAYKIVD